MTNEALREPPGADSYQWRVSVAEIGASGPFSSFVGYHRTMALLAGGGVRLVFEGGGENTLLRAGEMVAFDGALRTACELLAGPCTDLNLIVSKAISRPATRVETLTAPRIVYGERGRTTLLFAVRGTFIVTGLASASVFQQWDLAVLAHGDEIMLSPSELDATPTPLMFYATLDDNSQTPC